MTESPSLWRSLDEQEAAAAEFPELARAALINRRMAMRLMGASVALAAASACDRPRNPALRSAPEGQEGEVREYATSLEQEGLGVGVIVRTVGGRPVKIEGNPAHPASLGGSTVQMQAELLGAYDPDRSRTPVHKGRPVGWAEARRALAAWRRELVRRRGAGLAILIQPTASPTLERLLGRVGEVLPEARVHGWRPDDAVGGPQLVPMLDEADIIVSLGCDLLGSGPAQARFGRDWASRRVAGLRGGRMPRLIVAETVPSLTGAKADRRLALRPAEIVALAEALERGEDGPLLSALQAAGARGLVLAGREQPAEVHAIARRLNARSGALGVSAREIAPLMPVLEPIGPLVAALNAGAVSDLLILGGNPAHDAPADLHLAAAIRRAKRSLHLGLHRDETAGACLWHLPASHPLERWGDLRAFDGSVGLVQPAVIGGGLSDLELLGLMAGENGGGRGMMRRTWAAMDEEAWLTGLETGALSTSPPPFVPSSVETRSRAPTILDEARTERLVVEQLDVVFTPHPHLHDGRHANNAWLQELPHPLTRQVWGNAATLAPATAARLGVSNGDHVEIRSGETKLTAPVWVLPGQAAETIGLTLGHGRRAAGRVGSGVGVDAYPLRRSDAPWSARCTARKVPGTTRLVSTERHGATEDVQAVRRVRPGAPPLPRAAPQPTLHEKRRAQGERQWGMVIDLDACIGCGTCTIACQAENNIPVVGADEVARGREMHWIRVDRYHSGAAEAPATDFQPVPCMHCETAPCEPVCPVAATVHSSEGINQMTYNRCIGTRTCSNACPYKVRRFNWYDYHAEPGATPEAAMNPAVTVRDRGVMEKCTYCVHRIEAAHQAGDGTAPVTACQQACPTSAIHFGDIADAESNVAGLRRSPRHYALLDGLNLAPRTTYLARIEAEDG